MITSDQLTEIGRLGKPHGINGEINAYLDVDVDTDVMHRIVLLIDGIYVPFFIGSIRRKGADTLILALDDVNNEHEAASLTNHVLYALTADGVTEPDEMSDEDGFYASDLIGYTLTDCDSKIKIGLIADIDDSTENVLFIVDRPDGSTVYIPVADELIGDIDTDSHILSMALPSGILDL